MNDLENRFTYHKPNATQANLYTVLRSSALKLAELIDEAVPEGREKSLALTKLEETVMWANAGIARNQGACRDFEMGPTEKIKRGQ